MSASSSSLVKRPKIDNQVVQAGRDGYQKDARARKTSLSGPVIQLTGHNGPVLSLEYDSSGDYLASGGSLSDKLVLIWKAADDNANIGMLQGHKGAVVGLQWSRDSQQIYTCSTDRSLGIWSVTTGERIRKFEGHDGIVNSISINKRGTEIVVSGSDDGSIGMWDEREKHAVSYIRTQYPILAVASDTVGERIYSGGVDNVISTWDIRNSGKPLYQLEGHGDCMITSLQIWNDEKLLSNGTDSTVRTWDIRPFVSAPTRQLNVFDGAPSGIETNLIRAKWNSDGSRIAAGSGDSTVAIWDSFTRILLDKFPGHIGCVNDVSFSPKEPILASGSSDASIILREYLC